MNISEVGYLENGYTGLSNLGNTCFLNSCVQILTHTKELHAVFKSEALCAKLAANGATDEAKLFQEWKALTELMWSGNGVVSPMKFVKSVHEIATRKNIEIFTGWAQNDVTEFLRFVVNSFHGAVSRPVKVNVSGKAKTDMDNVAIQCCEMLGTVYKKEYSEIYELFYGISVTEIRRPGGPKCSQKPENFFIVDLPIPLTTPSPTLSDCFELFGGDEALIGDNRWFNEATGEKEDVVKRTYFWNFPKILVITLKRFLVSARGQISRINTLVTCPLSGLDLSKYVEGYDKNKYVYDLYGVSNHIGGPMGGHYTSFIKTNKGWMHYDDGSVSHVDESVVISPMAYCLFYSMRKK